MAQTLPFVFVAWAAVLAGRGLGAEAVTVTVLEVRTQDKLSAVYRVQNAGPEDVVLVSPESLSRIYDAERCTIMFSGEVKGRPGYYSFEPKLVQVARGTTKDFEVTFKRSELPASACESWKLSVTVSFLRASAAEGLRLGTEQDSRRYVAEHEALTGSAPFGFKP